MNFSKKYAYCFTKNLALTVASLVWLVSGCTSTTQPPTQKTIATEITESVWTEADDVRYQLALSQIETSPEAAKSTLKTLLSRHGTRVDLWVNLGIAHLKTGDYEPALKAADRAVELNGKVADIYNLRGLIALEKHEYRTAESEFHTAIAIDDRHALAHYNAGLLYDLYLRDIDKAISHYEQYLAANPDDKGTQLWVNQLKRSLKAG